MQVILTTPETAPPQKDLDLLLALAERLGFSWQLPEQADSSEGVYRPYNALTARVIEESRRGKNVTSYDSPDDLFEEPDKED